MNWYVNIVFIFICLGWLGVSQNCFWMSLILAKVYTSNSFDCCVTILLLCSLMNDAKTNSRNLIVRFFTILFSLYVCVKFLLDFQFTCFLPSPILQCFYVFYISSLFFHEFYALQSDIAYYCRFEHIFRALTCIRAMLPKVQECLRVETSSE